MKINKLNPTHWYYLALQAALTFAVITLRPFLRKPTKHIILLYGHQFSGHLAAIYTQWRVTDTTTLECYFLSLNPSPVLNGPARTVNILYCHRFRDMLTVAKASAMITDHGLHMMSSLVKFTDIVFIDVGHGIPFKGYDEQDFRLQHHYKEIWTSSQGISDLYATKCGCGNLVYSIGSPRTDKLVHSAEHRNSFRLFANIPVQAPVILYAPTWQQDDRGRALIPFGQSEEAFLQIFNTFCREHDCYLVFRSHQNASFTARPSDRVLFYPQIEYPDTEDILLDTDLLISDWSSIVFDYMVLDRPTIFLDVPHPFAKGCTLGPEYRFGYIAQSMDETVRALETYMHDPKQYLQKYGDNHRSVKEFVYDQFADGRTSQRCLQRLCSLLA